MNTMRPQQPMSAMVQASPTSQSRPRERLFHEIEGRLGERTEVRHDRRIDRPKAAEVAHPGDVLDGVRLPREPLACAPTVLLARAFEFAGGARQIIEDHIRLHDRKPAMAQRRAPGRSG
jgi:hypothetical protein